MVLEDIPFNNFKSYLYSLLGSLKTKNDERVLKNLTLDEGTILAAAINKVYIEYGLNGLLTRKIKMFQFRFSLRISNSCLIKDAC